MNIKKIGLIILLGVIVLLAVYIFSPRCDYYNWAWGGDIRECKCLGFKIDTSIKAADAPGTSKCIGIVKEYKCYNARNLSKEISCPN